MTSAPFECTLARIGAIRGVFAPVPGRSVPDSTMRETDGNTVKWTCTVLTSAHESVSVPTVLRSASKPLVHFRHQRAHSEGHAHSRRAGILRTVHFPRIHTGHIACHRHRDLGGNDEIDACGFVPRRAVGPRHSQRNIRPTVRS